MSTGLLIVLIALGVILVVYVAGMLWLYSKSHRPTKNGKADAADVATAKESLADIQPAEGENSAEQTEEQNAADNALTEETAEDEGTEEIKEERILIMMEDFEDKMKQYVNRIPFPEKVAQQPLPVQGYFNDVYNELVSHKRLHARVSKKCLTFRFGRELVAKIFIKGKTMRLALALDVNEFPENVYHQKDMSAKKAFAEIPFTVKLKSARSFKHALALIAALVEKKGMVKNPKFVPVNAVETINAAFKAKTGKTEQPEQQPESAQSEQTAQFEQVAQPEA